MSLTRIQLRLRAAAWLLLNRHEQAEAVFSEMLKPRPDDAYALASRCHVRAHLGRRAGAIEDAQQLVRFHPERPDAWFNLAFLLEGDERLDEAEAAFRKAVGIDPKLDRAWYGLGLTLIRQKRYDEAVEALRRNTELQPMSPYGWYQLARVHMDRNAPDETRKIIHHLKGFEPKVAEQLQRETGLAS